MKSKIKLLIVALAVCAAAFGGVRAFATGEFSSSLFNPITTAGDSQDWELTLVNATNPVPKGWSCELTQLSNGEAVDSRMYPALQQMFDDMRAEGIYPFVRAGYRSHEEQERILNERISAYQDAGYTKAQARELALKAVAEPGTSEHELGLAVDINAEEGKSDSSTVYDWLAENAYKYGFILRYPADKSDITRKDYEPWHYRYVGKDTAKEIYENKQCLEEYLSE